jgi:hypothetical protein
MGGRSRFREADPGYECKQDVEFARARGDTSQNGATQQPADANARAMQDESSVTRASSPTGRMYVRQSQWCRNTSPHARGGQRSQCERPMSDIQRAPHGRNATAGERAKKCERENPSAGQVDAPVSGSRSFFQFGGSTSVSRGFCTHMRWTMHATVKPPARREQGYRTGCPNEHQR